MQTIQSQAEFLETKFNELKDIYLRFLSINNPDLVQKTAFVNDAYNCLNVMNKIIAMSANGIAAEEQVQLQDQPIEEPQEVAIDTPEVLKNDAVREAVENVVDNMTESVEALKEDIDNVAQVEELQRKGEEFEKFLQEIDNMTEEEIVAFELDHYGLNKRLAGYKDLLNMRKAVELSGDTLNKGSDFQDILKYLAEANNISIPQLYKNIETLISKADFSQAVIIPLFKSIKEDGITISVEGFLREFVELFQIDEEENEEE